MRVSYSPLDSYDVFSRSISVTKLADLLDVARYNHVCGEFSNGKRTLDNFIGCDCVVMDVDNDGEDVVTPEQLHEIVPCPCFIVYSRHHMKQKNDSSPRPRYHVYYPLSRVMRSAVEVGDLKKMLCGVCSAFDPAAVDASRLIFGVSSPAGTFFDGGKRVDEFLGKPVSGLKSAIRNKTGVIAAGARNVTLFKEALRVLSRYSESDALEMYKLQAAKCSPPLPPAEIGKIWQNALRYMQKDALDKQKTRKTKPRLTLKTLSHELAQRNITVKYDLVTKTLQVSEFDVESLPAQYANLPPEERNLHRPAMLEDYLDGELYSDYSFTRDYLGSLISNYARLNGCCSPLELIRAAPWDGVSRFDKLCDLVSVDLSVDIPWRAWLRKWMLQSLALLENTVGHIGADFVLVLQGAQGVRKTSFFRRLALRPEWFREGQILDMRNKDLIIQAVSRWITELGELDSTLVKDQSSLKAFLTAAQDGFRLPYARLETKAPRVTSFCATVNPREFLRDMTGSRRFLVIPVIEISREIFTLSDDFFLGVWREIYNDYRLGSDWRLSEIEQSTSESANESYRTHLPYEDDVIQLCDFEAPIDQWRELNAAQVELELGLMGEARRIGRALAALSRRDGRVRVRIGHGRVAFYLLPPLRKFTANSPQTHRKLTDISRESSL